MPETFSDDELREMGVDPEEIGSVGFQGIDPAQARELDSDTLRALRLQHKLELVRQFSVASAADEFVYRVSDGTYRTLQGNVVPSSVTRGALDLALDSARETVKDLTTSLRDGDITLSRWQREMMDQIKSAHMNSASLAKGGYNQMGASDWGRVGGRVQREYEYLRNFARQIDEGDIPLDGRAVNRAGMYVDSARQTHHRVERLEMQKRGYNQERNILGVAEHCVAGGTRIYTAEGTLPVENACNNNTDKVVTSRSLDETNGVVMSGKKKCVRVTTDHGYELVCTPDHMLRAWDDEREQEVWVSAAEIRRRDEPFQLMMRRGAGWDHGGGESLDRVHAALIGYMDGNGHVSKTGREYADGTPKRQIGYTIPRADEERMREFQVAAAEHVGGKFNVNEHSKSDQVWLVRTGRRDASEWALAQDVKEPCIPERIWRSDPPSQAAYLRGLFDADGSVGAKGMTVSLSSAEKPFVRDVQDLLFGLGIVSNLTRRTGSTNYSDDRVLYTLRILGGPNLVKYIERVGFGVKRKSEKLRWPERPYTAGDTYPIKVHGRSSFPVVRDGVDEAIAGARSNEQAYRRVKLWADNRVFFSTVASIEDVGERRVYDVKESPTEDFLGDGFIVHNCPECVALTTRGDGGWVPTGTLPEIGTRQCLGNCKCRIVYRRTSPGEAVDPEPFPGNQV